MDNNNITILSGKGHPALGQEVAGLLKRMCGDIERITFADGEYYVRILESIRGGTVYIIQSPSPQRSDEHTEFLENHHYEMPRIHDNIMELLIMIDAARRSSADKVMMVLPYYPYARQDRRTKPREAITARLMADLYSAAGIDGAIMLELHAGQIEAFFDNRKKIEHIYSLPVIVEHFQEKLGAKFPDLAIAMVKNDPVSSEKFLEFVVVSPDAGGAPRARAMAEYFHASCAIIDKRRTGPNITEVMKIMGDVDKKPVLIIDDIIDTAGTITKAVKALKENGATEVYVAATHALLSGPAINLLKEAHIEEIVVTNSVPIPQYKKDQLPNLKVLSIAGVLAETINRVHQNKSVSSMFFKEKKK